MPAPDPRDARTPAVEEPSEEQLSDAHARFSGRRGLARTALALAVLSLMALVVMIPFGYMLAVSAKAPGEMGDGRVLPAALDGLMAGGETTWVRARLTADEAARLANSRIAKVSAGAPPAGAARGAAAAPPRVIQPARLVALEKPSDSGAPSDAVDALLEYNGRPATAAAAGAVASTLHIPLPAPRPGAPRLWTAAPATAKLRTPTDIARRLTANYRVLLNTDGLRAGAMGLADWLAKGYPRWFLNSLLVALVTVALGVFFDSLAAFAFAKFAFPGRRVLFALLLATVMVPYPVTLVPTFFIFAKLGLYNTYAALIIPGLVSAFGIFLVRQYLMTVPDDMLDAARVDGAGDFLLYRHVVLPTARPVLAALAVFRFIFQWNTYLYPLVLTNRDSMKTLQLGLASLEGQHGTIDYGLQMAGASIAVIPVLAVYAFMQKHFISGITMGSVKG